MLDQRGRLLQAALGFAELPRPAYDHALWALRFWLDSWAGIGAITVGMARQGFDLQLTRYDERGWRATFCTTGMEHSVHGPANRFPHGEPASFPLPGCPGEPQMNSVDGFGSDTPVPVVDGLRGITDHGSGRFRTIWHDDKS